MSAWYVLAAMGIHPICPGDGVYEITSPVFEKVEIDLDPSVGTRFAIDNIQGRVVPVPEPGTLLLLATGAIGLAGAARRRRSLED